MKPLVVFDGGCRLCTQNLAWLQRLDWMHVFESRPFQDESLYTQFPFLKREACEQSIHLIKSDGRTFHGGDAIRDILLRLPLTTPIGAILSLPPFRQLFRRLYPVIARNRYRWGGTCPIDKRSPQ